MFHKLLKMAEIDLIKNAALAFVIAVAASMYGPIYVSIGGFFFLIFLVMICGVSLDIVFMLVKKVFFKKNTVEN